MSDFHLWFLWISFSLITLSYILTKKLLIMKSSLSSIHLPPGPKPLPIIGNLLSIGKKPHQSLTSLSKIYGPIMSLKLGQVTTIVVSSPALATQVLLDNDLACSARHVPDVIRALRHNQVSVVWLPVCDSWRSLRKICTTQLFATQKLDANANLRKTKVRELVAYLSGRGTAGEAVDIGRAAFTTVLNLLSNTLFSVDLVDSYSESAQGFRDLMWEIMREAGGVNVSDLFPVLRGFDLQGRRRRVEKYFARVQGIFDELIEERLPGEKKKVDVGEAVVVGKDFLGILLDCQLDRLTLKSLLMDLLVAGTDTSSNTVEWAMAELLHNPTSMAKARTELLATTLISKDDTDDFNESDISQLPYLQAVVKETLRLHPPVPLLLPRRTETSVELSGYTIPKNTRVLVNAYAIGRDEKSWGAGDHPVEMFVPERFLGGGGRELLVETYKGRDCELIPFGNGRRICPGLPLASRVVHVILASMLRSFEWQLPVGMRAEDVDLTDKFGVTLALASPIRAIPFPEHSIKSTTVKSTM